MVACFPGDNASSVVVLMRPASLTCITLTTAMRQARHDDGTGKERLAVLGPAGGIVVAPVRPGAHRQPRARSDPVPGRRCRGWLLSGRGRVAESEYRGADGRGAHSGDSR